MYSARVALAGPGLGDPSMHIGLWSEFFNNFHACPFQWIKSENMFNFRKLAGISYECDSILKWG
jgi:hypothetical protein